ncbi:hypothetical protein RI065_01955 [Mycoplasmatota bacterium zrk1]
MWKRGVFPFISYKNDETETPAVGKTEKKPDYMDYLTVNTIEIDGESFELVRAHPKENETMVCFNFDFASVEFYDGVYETGCLNEYKVKYKNFEYHGWVIYEHGYMTMEELQSLGFPIEE